MVKKDCLPVINEKWCKACGLCVAFCPSKVFKADSFGRPQVDHKENCIGCKMCECRCPDFAITFPNS